MIPIFMMFLGLGLIIWSLYLIKREIEKGNLKLTRSIESFDDSSAAKLLQVLEELEDQMAQMNQSFYDLVSDLEGSFSLHDKELQLLTERMVKIEKQLGLITSEIRITHDNREIQGSRNKQSKAYQSGQAKASSSDVRSHVDHMNESKQSTKALLNDLPLDNQEATHSSNDRKAVLSLSPEESSELKQRIVSLRKEGHNLSQIAKILNIGIGELQLFIKLNTK